MSANNNRGGGGGGRGGGRQPRPSHEGVPPESQAANASLQPPPRVSALGNVLPTKKGSEAPPTVLSGPKKDAIPTFGPLPTSSAAIGGRLAEIGPPTVKVGGVAKSTPLGGVGGTSGADRGRANDQHGGRARQGSDAGSTQKKKSQSGGKNSGPSAPPPLAVPDEPIHAPPFQRESHQQQQRQRQDRPPKQNQPQHHPRGSVANAPEPSPRSTGNKYSDMPETLNSSTWGDDAEDSVSQEVIETRLRTQLERARQEKVALQKQIASLQSDVEKAHMEGNKSKSDADQLKTQIEKVATMEKSFASLRQTRDALETERDQLKREFVKVEKELKALKEETQKRITKLQVDADAYQAEVEYQKLEIEEARADIASKQARINHLEATSSGGLSIASPAPSALSGTWVYACSPGSSLEKIADALSFSNLELSSVNASLWSDSDDLGFRKSLSVAVFERGGENVNPDSPGFDSEIKEALMRCVQSSEMLMFVPKRQLPHLSPPRYEQYVTKLVQLFADARDAASASARVSSLLLEDYPFNRIVIRTVEDTSAGKPNRKASTRGQWIYL